MPDITVTITDGELNALQYVTSDIADWADNALTHRAYAASVEIIKRLVPYCNENNIQIATGTDAQVQQAYDLGVVQKAADRTPPPAPDGS